MPNNARRKREQKSPGDEFADLWETHTGHPSHEEEDRTQKMEKSPGDEFADLMETHTGHPSHEDD